MIERDDLRAAVGAGILSESQAASLTSLADSRRGDRENLSAGDEPFELFRGFNEIFIVVGFGILTVGWIGVNVAGYATEVLDYRRQISIAAIIAALVLWGLSEYFIQRRRMVAPAIALSILFAVNAAIGLIGYQAQPFMLAREDFSSLTMPVALATLATAIYWWRFKVPFAMAMIAVAAFALSMLIAANASGTPSGFEDLFLLSSGGPFAWITLILGILVFALAIAFDMSDPHRVTRRSAQGFWLHVVAAPALINTIALTLLDRGATGSTFALVFVLLFFAFVAIVIDRRSFLIAAIGYVVVLSSTIFDTKSAATAVLILGILLVLLGAFWERIRARLLQTLPKGFPIHNFPPST
ncbi:MAG: hypothetical protein ACU0C9_10745 [Paracoccaceae bacterium]